MRTKYHEAIVMAMNYLATFPETIFLGQQVLSEDFYDTLTDVPHHARREMPVAEDMQMGLSIGMALEGYFPVTIYQRMDFLPRAMDQLENHLNLLPKLSRNTYCPRMIIRTTVGATKPLDAGLQHTGNLVKVMKTALDFPVLEVKTAKEVFDVYHFAIHSHLPTMIIEHQELYNEV